jgi:hypothetical protein
MSRKWTTSPEKGAGGRGVGVNRGVGVRVGVGVGVIVCVGVIVGPGGRGVLVQVAVRGGVNVGDGDRVSVGVAVRVGVAEDVDVAVAVAVAVSSPESDGAAVETVGRTVGVGEELGDGLGDRPDVGRPTVGEAIETAGAVGSAPHPAKVFRMMTNSRATASAGAFCPHLRRRGH